MSGLSFEVWVECLHLCVSSVNDVYELYFDVCVGFFVGNISIYLQPLVQNMKTQKEALHDTDGKKSVSATEAQDFLLHCLSGSCCLINPRRACARVTVVVLCVCLSVYPSVPALAASASVETSKQRYSRVSLRLFLD